MFEYERLTGAILEAVRANARPCQHVSACLDAFRGGRDASDDMTLVAIERQSASDGAPPAAIVSRGA